MVDILLSSDDLSVFGGPDSIDLNVDSGAQGVRGSLILTGPGKPTDAGVTFLTPPMPQDLYINLLPSDFEYLFLYQYGSVNGVLTWSKVLRLIPNTAIANISVVFLDGKASRIEPTPAGLTRIGIIQLASAPGTTVESVIQSIIDGIVPLDRVSPIAPASPTSGMHWVDISNLLLPTPATPVMKSYNGTSWVTAAETVGPTNFWIDFLTSPTIPQLKRWTGSAFETLASIPTGLLFPISDYFSAEEVAVGATSGFNVQYIIRNETPISSGVTLGSLTTIGSKVYLPVNLTAAETIAFSPGSLLTWQKINGVKTLNFVLVAGIGKLPLV